MVIRISGHDGPGITGYFLKCIAEHGGLVLDMCQFLLEGSLVFNVVLQVANNCSMLLMTDLLRCGRSHKLDLDFHFPDREEEDEMMTRQLTPIRSAIAKQGVTPFRCDGAAENMAAMIIASPEDITPALLQGLDSVLCQHGCAVHDIEHRSDDKLMINGEYNKLQMRVSCPKGLKLSTLYMGDGTDSDVGSARSLQAVAAENNAVVIIRWWDAMNRPSGKSLVVFGLSGVLYNGNVLGEVMEAAGVDPGLITRSVSSSWSRGVACTPLTQEKMLQENREKVTLLKGKSADCVQKVVKNMKFTPGARLLCRALRTMGCRLAIQSSHGVKEIGEHCKRELGIDFSMCRELEVVDGKFTGNMSDGNCGSASNSDLLMMIAEKEDIECKNVILVGEFLKGLTISKARTVLETFGINVYFNTSKLNDLTVVLYLLGFSGCNIRDLKGRFESEPQTVEMPRPMHKVTSSESMFSMCSSEGGVQRYLIEVYTRKQEPGLLQRVLAPLLPFGATVSLATVRQCSLLEGGLCLGIDLRSCGEDKDKAAKLLLFACKVNGFQTKLTEPTEKIQKKTVAQSMQHYSENRYVVSCIQTPWISSAGLRDVCECMTRKSVNIVRMDRLSSYFLSALQLTCILPPDLDVHDFSCELQQASAKHSLDVAIQKDDTDRWLRRMVFFDMGGCLVLEDIATEMAEIAGVLAETRAVTKAHARGEISFTELLSKHVALLKGHDADAMFSKIEEKLTITPGAVRLCSALRKLGYKTAVLSTSYLPIAHLIQRKLGLNYAYGNALEVDDSGKFTGKVCGEMVTPDRKLTLLAESAKAQGCEVQQTVAIGDSWALYGLLQGFAGLGIAFRTSAKRIELAHQEDTDCIINHTDLSLVLYLIGLSQHAVERLGGSGSEAGSMPTSPESSPLGTALDPDSANKTFGTAHEDGWDPQI